MKVRILGCGTSSGVPRIGNDWGACDPNNPRNRRTRVSILIESATTRILVDTGPDMRAQLLAAEVATFDAVIWTHDHADHTHGIDDLRQVFHALGRPVQGYARPATAAALRHRFDYVFAGKGGYPPTVALNELRDHLTIGDIVISVADQPHGSITSAGLRFSQAGVNVGYATDFNKMTDNMRTIYQGLNLWIADALRYAPHPSHPTVPDTLAWADELAPAKTILTHMDQSLDYAILAAALPNGVEPGYDGQEIAW